MPPHNIDDEITHILDHCKTIALVGASDKEDRPSHEVMAFLQHRGYRVIPVSPRLAGQELLGEQVYASLTDIPEPFDMVDLFLNVDRVEAVVDEALKTSARVIWMQLHIEHESAAAKARAQGRQVIMNHCPKIELTKRHR